MRRQRNFGPDFLFPHNIDQGHLNSPHQLQGEKMSRYSYTKRVREKSAFLSFVQTANKEYEEKNKYMSLFFVKKLLKFISDGSGHIDRCTF